MEVVAHSLFLRAPDSESSVSKRFRASATTSALLVLTSPPIGSTIEADWSTRKMKQDGLVRLISAAYGTDTPFVGWPAVTHPQHAKNHDAIAFGRGSPLASLERHHLRTR